MALQKNKVKFGLNKVHWAKITAWSDDGVPTFATPVRLPGAVSLSIDANGENENFYADNSVYYVINNNAGYDGDLEVALITTDFATAILGEQLDAKGVLVERNDAETSQFALMFEFDGDKNHIRHVLYCCSASRPATEGETTEESKSVKTEKLSLKASALPNGLVKSKTCESTDQTTYDNWYNAVYMPTAATTAFEAMGSLIDYDDAVKVTVPLFLIETNDPSVFYSNEDIDKFSVLFNGIESTEEINVDSQTKLIKEYWHQSGILFPDNDKISLITIWFNGQDIYTDNDQYILHCGHAAIMIHTENDDVLLLEKLDYTFPYQLIRFPSEAKALQYVVEFYCGEIEGAVIEPIVFVNDHQLKIKNGLFVY